MYRQLFALVRFGFMVMLLTASPSAASEECDRLGACTLPDGSCGFACNGTCLTYDEGWCCAAGMCYRDGTWCGGVPYDGDCLPPDEARCLMSGCRLENGECVCAPSRSQ